MRYNSFSSEANSIVRDFCWNRFVIVRYNLKILAFSAALGLFLGIRCCWDLSTSHWLERVDSAKLKFFKQAYILIWSNPSSTIKWHWCYKKKQKTTIGYFTKILNQIKSETLKMTPLRFLQRKKFANQSFWPCAKSWFGKLKLARLGLQEITSELSWVSFVD